MTQNRQISSVVFLVFSFSWSLVFTCLNIGRSTTTHVVLSTPEDDDVPLGSRSQPLRGALLHMKAEWVWDQLLQERAQHNDVAMEVGMHKAKQCLQAAQLGYQVHCVEPSPQNFYRVEKRVKAVIAEQQADSQQLEQRIHLYQAAAAAESNQTVKFTATGGTGDHVGDFDIWNMKAGDNGGSTEKAETTVGELVTEVPTIRLDDIIEHKLEGDANQVHLLKVDTQGFEPAVVAGLSNSLRNHKVDFLLMEFWPSGIDLISGGPEGASCSILNTLQEYGYILYALHPETHPNAPQKGKDKLMKFNTETPLFSVTAYCRYFYDMAEKNPDPTYKMGYWADVLAVRPSITTTHGSAPSTEVMKAIDNDLSRKVHNVSRTN